MGVNGRKNWVPLPRQVFAIRTPFGFISVFGLTVWLKLEIIVCILWLAEENGDVGSISTHVLEFIK